jgi:hypothetical protein
MTLIDYFIKRQQNKIKYFKELSNKTAPKQPSWTIEDFYNDFIKQHAEYLYKTKLPAVLKWCDVIEDYLKNNSLPIYWVRKFENKQKGLNNNRRASLSFLCEQGTNNIVGYYVFVSNFDAQEFYNIILNVDILN